MIASPPYFMERAHKMTELEMLEKAEQYTETLRKVTVVICAYVALLKFGFEAGRAYQSRQDTPEPLFHMGD